MGSDGLTHSYRYTRVCLQSFSGVLEVLGKVFVFVSSDGLVSSDAARLYPFSLSSPAIMVKTASLSPSVLAPCAAAAELRAPAVYQPSSSVDQRSESAPENCVRKVRSSSAPPSAFHPPPPSSVSAGVSLPDATLCCTTTEGLFFGRARCTNSSAIHAGYMYRAG